MGPREQRGRLNNGLSEVGTRSSMGTIDAIGTGENRGRRWNSVVRVVATCCLFPVLVYLCLQTEHAGLKGMPIEKWRPIPIVLCVLVTASLGKRYVNPMTGMLLGGVGGALGSHQWAGPYGVSVGLPVGIVIALLPIMRKPQLKDDE
jgi:hypothetical protein